MSWPFAEFFAGAGMARHGLGDGWRCVFANDFDAKKAESYRANFGADELHVADVALLKARDVPTVDLAWASPPCQDVSLAGDRKGLDGERSGAFWPFHHLMRELLAEGRAPKIIAIENVESLLSSNQGADFTAIVDAFAAIGYRVGALVVDAALFLPQSRKRVFIVCVRASAIVPDGLTQPGPSAPFHTRAVTGAFQRLPAALQRDWRWWRLATPPTRQITLADILERDARRGDPADAARLLELMAPRHRAKVDHAMRTRAAGAIVVGGVNRRMRNGQQRAEVRFGLAQALRTASGGSSIQTVLIGDDNGMHARKLRPREAARLMGIPDSYRLPGGVTDAHNLTGDGVVAPVVQWLAARLLAPILAHQSVRAALARSRRAVRQNMESEMEDVETIEQKIADIDDNIADTLSDIAQTANSLNVDDAAVVWIRYPGGGELPLRLAPERAERYRADPEAFAAEYFKLSKADYREWLATHGIPQCGAPTKAGRKCTYPISSSSLSAAEWSRRHHGDES